MGHPLPAAEPAGWQAAFEELAGGRGPGLFAQVLDGDQAVFTASAGTADLDDPRPIDAADRLRVGSITKTFVAALVLLLVAEERLGLDDPVERWLPGMVPAGGRITVEHLLRLRSGLPDYVRALVGDPPDPGVLLRYHPPEHLVRLSVAQPDHGEPGAAWRYSNTDYVLLGLVVEAATGQRVDAQLWQRILDPLGLWGTDLPHADPCLRGPHARGYLRLSPTAPFVEFTAVTPSESWTSGAVVSTPGDLARFLDALLGGRLLPPRQLAAMRSALPTGQPGYGYGMGLQRFEFPDGTVVYGHRGDTIGFSCSAFRSDSGRTVVIYQNALDVTVQGIPRDNPLARAAFGVSPPSVTGR